MSPRRRAHRSGLTLIALSCAACAGTGAGNGGVSPFGAAIDSDQLTSAAGYTAYDVVAQLRPRWLRPRGSPTLTDADPYPAVYLDGIHFGRPSDLRAVPATELQSIEFLSSTDATTRFGTNHGAGAIMVTTRSR